VSDTLQVVCSRCNTTNRVARDRLEQGATCGKCKQALFDGRPFELSRANFDRQVATSELPLVVDFWAPWCGPCRVVAPVLEEIASERPDLRIVKLNTDENQQTAAQFQVLSIPTMILFKGGQPVKTVVGAYPKKKLEAELEPALSVA